METFSCSMETIPLSLGKFMSRLVVFRWKSLVVELKPSRRVWVNLRPALGKFTSRLVIVRWKTKVFSWKPVVFQWKPPRRVWVNLCPAFNFSMTTFSFYDLVLFPWTHLIFCTEAFSFSMETVAPSLGKFTSRLVVFQWKPLVVLWKPSRRA